MARKDRVPPTPTISRTKPTGSTCGKHVQTEGKRRACDTEDDACSLTDDVDSEWLTANGQQPATSQRTLPFLDEQPSPRRAAAALPPRPAPCFASDSCTTAAMTVSVTPPRNDAPSSSSSEFPPCLGPDDIASFKALGVEVHLYSALHGELWLVPAYTGKPRKEITPEHAVTLMRVLSVLPGSHVIAFDKTRSPIPSAESAPRGAHAHQAVSETTPVPRLPVSVRGVPA